MEVPEKAGMDEHPKTKICGILWALVNIERGYDLNPVGVKFKIALSRHGVDLA